MEGHLRPLEKWKATWNAYNSKTDQNQGTIASGFEFNFDFTFYVAIKLNFAYASEIHQYVSYLIINYHLTDNWQMAKILTDNWHL